MFDCSGVIVQGLGSRQARLARVNGLGILVQGLSLKVGRGSARAADVQGTPTQSHISPSIFEYTKIRKEACLFGDGELRARLIV